MSGEPLFSADNAHAVGSGTPPHVRREPNRYHGYFENAFGEQWIFVFDYAEKRGWLRGGDAGWEWYAVAARIAFATWSPSLP